MYFSARHICQAGFTIRRRRKISRSLRTTASPGFYYLTASGPPFYHVHHVLVGSGLMLGAGTLSGLLGIGSRALKVIAMDDARYRFQGVDNSNFMIGVTTAARVGLYWRRGYIDPNGHS